MLRRLLLTLIAIASCAPLRGSFSIPIRLSLPAEFNATALVAADFDGDRNLDLAVAGESGRLIVFLNSGKGGFRSTGPYDAGPHPSSLAAADMDGDGNCDLVVANHETQSLTLLSGDGRGHFSSRQLPVHSEPHPHAIAVADFDGDRRMDIVVDSWMENRLMILSGRNGWQAPGLPVEVGRKPYWNIAVADLDGDGSTDIVVPNQGRGTVSVLLGDGHAHLRHASGSPFSAGALPFSVAVGDMNGDHRPDIAVVNYSGHVSDTAGDGLTWIRNDGQGRFTAMPDRVASGRYSARVTTGDVNGDGYDDVAFSNTASRTVSIVYGSRRGPRNAASVMTMNAPHALLLADLDGDGRSDLAVSGDGSTELRVYFSRQ
ncbi:MAG: VCBS repeat-containing protein [Acidobacteriota bacterium]